MCEPNALETNFTQLRPQMHNTVCLSVQNIQMDNQMSGRGNYDFPVVLRQGDDSSTRFLNLGR